VLLVVLLQQTLSDADLRSWGWRIPFVVGAVTAVVALLLRRTLQETTTAETRANKDAGSLGNLFHHAGAGDSEFLHLDQRHCEGGDVSD
jgi:MHS family dicarboxylic acid transporter PcaT-like MFS transporter